MCKINDDIKVEFVSRKDWYKLEKIFKKIRKEGKDYFYQKILNFGKWFIDKDTFSKKNRKENGIKTKSVFTWSNFYEYRNINFNKISKNKIN